MLHFQHAENGACIRPSELKPKLDRFLLSKPVKRSDDNKIPKMWRNNGQEKALNYKVFIQPEDSTAVSKSDTINRDIKLHEISIRKGAKEEKEKEKFRIKNEYRYKGIDGLFFGNMVKSKESQYNALVRASYKETVFYEKPIKLKIVCHIPGLLEHIDNHIDEFFAITNFGTRQNKGFGSFLIIRDFGLTDVNKKLRAGGYCYIRATIDGRSSITNEEGFKIASAVYSVMKGGINFPSKDSKSTGLYIKGYIQRQYLDDIGLNNIGSDKAFVKSDILTVAPKKRDSLRNIAEKPDDEPERSRSYTDYLYVRALLGVADHVEYRDKDGLREGVVSISSDKVERFPSIITIKITDEAVYFIISDPDKEIFGKDFEFSSDVKTGSIKTPDSFDKNRFKSDFITYFNSVRSRFENSKIYEMCTNVNLT